LSIKQAENEKGQQNCYCFLESDLGKIIAAAETLLAVNQIILFEHYTKEPNKFVSDIDLAIKDKAVIYDTVNHLIDLLNEKKPSLYLF
jgi:predicted nucleotidyltransferase